MKPYLLFFLSFSIYAFNQEFYEKKERAEVLSSYSDTLEDFEKIFAKSDLYSVDIDGDKTEETIHIEKTHQRDRLVIHDQIGRKLHSIDIRSTAINSYLFKLSIYNLSSEIKSIVFHHYEGFTEAHHFEASSYVYIYLFEKGKLKEGKLHKGPQVFLEKLDRRGQYQRRFSRIFAEDVNRDGVRDFIIDYQGRKRTLIVDRLTLTQVEG